MSVTSFTIKQLGKAKIAATAVGSADAIATNITGEDMTITNIIGRNQDSVARTIYLCNVPDGDTPDADDVFYEREIPAGGSFFIRPEDIKMVMSDTDDALKAYASATNIFNVWAFGSVQPDQS